MIRFIKFFKLLVAFLPVLVSINGLAGEITITAHPSLDSVKMRGPDSRQQMVVMSEKNTDVTRTVTFSAKPEAIVTVSKSGLIAPLANGTATILAAKTGDTPASISVTVSDFEKPQPISFPNDIVPVITRNNCNAGACHAKAEGQNGFSLSLFGYDPEIDFETLVKNSRGRRVMPTAPDHSILLMKASGNLPHGGGARLDSESADYALIRRWIAEGAEYVLENDPTVERIEIFPRDLVVKAGSNQQLLVTAFFDDGSVRDISRAAQFEPNQEEMAHVDENGLVTFENKTGSTSVMVRFQEHVDVFRATIPLGETITELPKPENFIDEEIFKKLSVLGIPPSKLSDDASFLRRVTIDITGRIPTLDETNQFMASTDPGKRAKRIDALLNTSEYGDYFAGKWAGLLRNKSNRGLAWVSRDTFAFHSWIRTSLIENKPFDELVGELITASGTTSENPAASWYRAVTDPKERMQDIAQVFLGIRMQCAQCHHHPYERWSQDDYYGFTAFFSTIDRKEVYRLPEDDIIFHNRKLAQVLNPATQVNLKPTAPGGEPLDIPAEIDPRHDLAEWVRDKENPWFATVLANRYWKHFFSQGLVEPEDDIRPTNPATHPELLERLADHFVESGYDLKSLIRVICNSRTYQLEAIPNEVNADDTQNYARFYPKRLQAEVLLDAFNDVTGAKNSFNQQPAGVRAIALPDDNSNKESEFLTMFGRPQMDSACECERTGEANLGQSLHLINADLIQKKLSVGDGRALTLAKAMDRSDDDRLTELYLTALSRKPDADELNIAKAHLVKKRKAAEKPADPIAEQQAFEDIIWVLVNTKEFLFNH